MSRAPRSYVTSSVLVPALLLGAVLVGMLSPADVRATAVVQIATVNVSSSLGSASYPILVAPSPDGNYQYLSGPDPIEIFSSDANHNLLATIEPFGLSVTLDSDPAAGLSFGVLSGNAPTNFTIATAPVSFGALSNPLGIASAALTVTDFDSDGASMTGSYPVGLAFQATYNGPNVFATLAPSISASASDSIASTPNVPPTVGSILGAVTSIQSSFSFQLSANDLGSGSGTFSVPEPGTFALLAMAAIGLLAFSRRHR